MSTQQQRVITVYATQGKPTNKYTTDVTLWSELKTMLTKDGYNLSSLLATESVRRTDLINEKAVLPEEDFTVFLRPAKTKSGAQDVSEMSYRELRNTIKSEIENGGEAARDFFNEGKSYTNKTTDAMRELLHDWFAGDKSTNAAATVADVASDENMSDDQKLELIKRLAEEINSGGKYTVTIESVENQSEEELEAERLEAEYQEIIGDYKVTICYLKK